jgi:hypothetical protein
MQVLLIWINTKSISRSQSKLMLEIISHLLKQFLVLWQKHHPRKHYLKFWREVLNNSKTLLVETITWSLRHRNKLLDWFKANSSMPLQDTKVHYLKILTGIELLLRVSQAPTQRKELIWMMWKKRWDHNRRGIHLY